MKAVMLAVRAGVPAALFVSFFSTSCITVYGLAFLADNSRYVHVAALIFKPVLKGMWSIHVWLLP